MQILETESITPDTPRTMTDSDWLYGRVQTCEWLCLSTVSLFDVYCGSGCSGWATDSPVRPPAVLADADRWIWHALLNAWPRWTARHARCSQMQIVNQPISWQ